MKVNVRLKPEFGGYVVEDVQTRPDVFVGDVLNCMTIMWPGGDTEVYDAHFYDTVDSGVMVDSFVGEVISSNSITLH